MPISPSDEDKIEVERLGGLAGFGVGGLRSKGQCRASELPTADQSALERFFATGTERLNQEANASQMRDAFVYRLTRQRAGKAEQVEVPETLIPPSIRACVRDTLE